MLTSRFYPFMAAPRTPAALPTNLATLSMRHMVVSNMAKQIHARRLGIGNNWRRRLRFLRVHTFFLQLTGWGLVAPQKDASPACEGEKEKELRHRIHHHGIMVCFFPAVMLLMVQRSHSQPPFWMVLKPCKEWDIFPYQLVSCCRLSGCHQR